MSLMNLAQIKGGLALKNNVEALLQSYDAAKVLTSIVKTPAAEGTEAVNYNVDELLKDLKQKLAAITGEGEEGGASLASLKASIDALKDKKIQDVVRMELAVAGGKAAIPADLATKVPNVDTAKALPAYSVNNEVLLNEKGEQLTVSLADGSFNGTPSVVDEAASAKMADGSMVYKAAAVTAVKVFPQGEWTLETLPADALLDNNEMQLIAYETALNKLVVELAKDQSLIEDVKTKIGEKAVSDQLDAKVKDLQASIDQKANITDVFTVADDGTKTPLYRKVADKLNLSDMNEDLQDVIRTAATPNIFDPSELVAEDAKKLDKANVVKSDVDTTAADYAASDEKVLSEKAALAAIKKVADSVDHVKTDIESAADKAVVENVAVTGAVTEFALTSTPTNDLVKMVINHLVYVENEDFTVDRAAKKVTWTLTAANNGFDIDAELTDKVTFEYKTKPAKA